jgi:twinkle protein
MPTGQRGTATTAGTTARGGIKRLASLTLPAEEALVARGLDIEACVRMGLTSAVVHGTDDWIAIPTLRDSRAVRWKYRRVEKVEGAENFMQEPGGEQCVWNPAALTDETLRGEPLIITEGEFDAIAAIQSGFGRVVSLPNGSTIPTGAQSSAWIDEVLSSVAAADQIIIAADDDEPGIKARADLAIRLGAGRCKYLTYPRGCKDLNDALKGFGQRGVVESFNRARWCRVSGVFLMSELPPLPTEEPLHSGVPGLGEHYRIRRGDLCVMTGIPGHGKSTFVNDLACRMVERHGWTVGFASFEQSPALDHKRALRTWFGGKPARTQSPTELAEADAWVDQHFAFIVPEDDDDASLDWVMERAASLVVRYGCQMIVVDPWNEIEHDRPRDWSLTEYVNSAIRRFKRFAKKWNVHLIIVAHPTKLQRQSDGKMPIPNLYDISDSAAWANKADIGVIVHRDEARSIIRVAKSRYHEEIGKPGQIEVTFSEYNNRFC